MKLSPRPRSVFEGILPGKAKGALGPAAPAGLHLNIEEHEMGMRVRHVVAVLVVDGRYIPRDTLAQLFRVCPRQSFSLLMRCLRWQSNDEPLTDPPLAPLCFVLGKAGCFGLCAA